MANFIYAKRKKRYAKRKKRYAKRKKRYAKRIYMGFKIYDTEVSEILYNAQNTTYKTDLIGNTEFKSNFKHKNFNGSFKEIRLQNFRISYSNSNFSKTTDLLFDFGGESVEMHFTLKGNSKCKIKNTNIDFEYTNNFHNILYSSSIRGEITFSSPHVSFLEINLHPHFFEKYLPNEELFAQFKELIQHKKTSFLGGHNFPITAEMMNIIQQIITCKWEDNYRSLFLEAKVLELLLLQLDQISSYDISLSYKKTSSEEIINKMMLVQEIILNKLDENLLLSDLAKIVYTNTSTLKKEFKKLHGITVGKYITEKKMNKAKELLIKKGLSIRDVSEAIGYKNPQHFSTAFKREFGFSPSMLKQKVIT